MYSRTFQLRLYNPKLIHINANFFFSYNKFTQIAARAVRQSLKETERVAAEKRGVTALRYQKWEDGRGGQQVRWLDFGSQLQEISDVDDFFGCAVGVFEP